MFMHGPTWGINMGSQFYAEAHQISGKEDTCSFRTWQESVGTLRDKSLPSSSPALISGCVPQHHVLMPDLGLFPTGNKVIR